MAVNIRPASGHLICHPSRAHALEYIWVDGASECWVRHRGRSDSSVNLPHVSIEGLEHAPPRPALPIEM